MTDKQTGGPAFPVSGMTGRGMTLRDYFIAHAPAEPQPWFSPVVPAKEAPLLPFLQMFPDSTEEERRAVSNFNAEWMIVEDVKEERARAYLFQKEQYRQRLRQFASMVERERYIQWPAAWADAMLRAREGGA